MPLFKALQHLSCQGKEYAPGEIIPGAASFPNWKELLEWRYIGYASEDEIKAYEAREAEDVAKNAEKEKANTDAEDVAKNKK